LATLRHFDSPWSLQLYNPPFGSVNNADGGRSHTYADYRQE
jgi:hypothetical protein